MSVVSAAGLLFMVGAITGFYAFFGRDEARVLAFVFTISSVLFFLPYAYIVVEAFESFGYVAMTSAGAMKEWVALPWLVSGIVLFAFCRYTGIAINRVVED